MVKWLPSFGRSSSSASPGNAFAGGPGVDLERKDAPTRRAAGGRGYAYGGQAYVPPGPDVERLVRDGYEKVIWVFKAIDAIADKVSDWPIIVESGRGDDIKPVDDDPILPLLNEYSNEIERAAKYFRYRLITQLLMSKRGVFVEVIPTRAGGKFAALNLLPPAYTSPLPDRDRFIAAFRVDIPGEDGYTDLPVYDHKKRAGVVWIRKPHPTDPYSSVTPLEAAGISIDLDFYARLYNRNFLVNDGRAGQIVAVKGHMSHEDAMELKARFSPGMGGAGRTTVIEADAVNVSDTAVSPRDAQYAELRSITKEDLLLALGTPESVIGKAAGVTYDSADAELWNWLTVTCQPLSRVVDAGLDPLTAGGWGDDRRIRHDVTHEPVLQRIHEALLEKGRRDVAAGLMTIDEWRDLAGRDELKRPASRVLWIPGGKVAVGDAADEEYAAQMKPVGAPPDPMGGGGMGGGFGGDPAGGFDGQGSGGTAGGGQGGGDGALGDGGGVPIAQGEDLAGGAFTDASEGKALPVLEQKRFNPAQPRYPRGHPRAGQWLDTGDVALWLAGKPFKDGTSSAGVVNPNAGSTAGPAVTAGGLGGAAALTAHADPKVRAAAAVVTFPAGYAYARVLGAPVASAVKPKQIKAVSLRKGDAVRVNGTVYSIADNKRTLGAKGDITFELVAADGSTTTIQSAQQSTLESVARTPHPTVVAQAKRDLGAAARALAGQQAATAAAQPMTPAVIPGGVPRGGQVYSGPGGTLTITPAGNAMYVGPSGGAPRLRSGAAALSLLQGNNGYQLQAAPPAAAAAPRGPFPNPPSGKYSSVMTGAQLTVYTDGTGSLQSAGGGASPLTSGDVNRYLVGLGASWQQDSVVAIPNPKPIRTMTAPTPATRPAAPAAAAPAAAPTASKLPAPIPGDTVYRHPSGKHIYVSPSGSIVVWKPDGKRGSSSATGAKLAAGHGQWKQVTAPDGWLRGPTGSYTRDPNWTPAGAPAPVTRATAPAPAAAPAVVPATTPPPATTAAPASSASAAAVVNLGVPQVTVGAGWTLDTSLPQSGSNPAAGMLDPSGRRFYVKSQPAKVADNEVAAARLYAAAGVAVPTISRATVQGSPFAGVSGSDGIASAVVPLTNDVPARMRRDPAFRDKVLEDFAVHAWLGNWDAMENNNTATDASGRPLTVDVGGSLMYRARGGARKLTGTVAELQSMRGGTAGPASKAAFAQLTPDQTDARFVAGVERIAAISPSQLRGLLDSSLPSHSAKARRDLADVMLQRRAELARRAGVTLPENRATPAPAAVPAAVAPVTPPAPAVPAAAPGVPLTPAQAAQGAAVTALFNQLTAPTVGQVGPFSASAPGIYENPDGQLVVRPDGTGTIISSANPPAISQFSAAVVSSILRNAGANAWTYTSTSTVGRPGSAVAGTPAPPIVAAAATPSSKLGGQSPQSILTPPPGYPYGVVPGAPVATALKAQKDIKVASLRKGDVVVSPAGVVVTIDSTSGGSISGVDDQGRPVSWVHNGDDQPTVARTPHPTVVAAARRALAQQATPAAQQATPAAAAPSSPPPVAAGTPGMATVSPGAQAVAVYQAAGSQFDYDSSNGPMSGLTYVSMWGDTLTVQSDGSAVFASVTLGNTSVLPAGPRVDAELQTGYRYAAPSVVATVPAGPPPGAPAKTTPAFGAGVGAAARYATIGARPQSGGYRPVPGQTYGTPSGDIIVVHPDGSADITPHPPGSSAVPMSAAQVEQTLQPGTTFAPIGPNLTTPGYSHRVGRHTTGSGDVLDVNPDGTGTFTGWRAGSSPTAMSETAVDQLLSSGAGFQFEAPSPAGSGNAVPAAVPAGPISAPAGGWVASGQILPGAVFALPNGTTLTVGPRGGGKLQLSGQQTTTNMSAAAMRSSLTRPSPSATPWQLRTASPQASLTPGTAGSPTAPRTPPAPSARVGASGVASVPPGGKLPPPGTPVMGTIRSGQPSVFPVAATGPVTPTAGRSVTRGMTVRVGSDDYVVTEVLPIRGGGVRVFGYRPGVDDPLVITQDPTSLQWLQGRELPASTQRRGAQLDVVAPTPAPAANVPAGGKARAFDPARGLATTTQGVGVAGGTGTTAVETQNVGADTLQAGDAILINGREAEGPFVVSSVGPDGRGRQSVFGWAPGKDPKVDAPEKLFLTNPGSAMRQSRVLVDGAPASIPDVPRPRPPMSSGGIVRNDISDATSQAELQRILAAAGSYRASSLKHPPTTATVGNVVSANLMELRGYNAHPDVVSDTELDSYVAAGEIELWRGVKQDASGVDYVEDFRSGKHYSGGLGGAQFGTGTYTAYGKNAKAGSRGGATKPFDSVKFAMGYAAGKAGSTAAQGGPGKGNKNAAVMRMTLKADARIAEYDKLRDQQYSEQDYNVRNLDVGQYAVYLGYDAMRKSNAYAASVTAGRKDDWTSGFLIVVNRSAVRVSSKTYVDDGYVRSAKPGADPPPKGWTEARHVMKPSTAKHAASVDFSPKAA